MKNYIKVLFILLISFLTFSVNAETYKIRVTYDGVNIRKGPGTNYGTDGKAYMGEIYELLDSSLVEDKKGCSAGWYKFNNQGKEDYICSTYAAKFLVPETLAGGSLTACEQSLKDKGFPSSYWPYLCALQKDYPDWEFTPDMNHLDFATAVSKEAVGKKALIESSYQGYLSTDADSYNYLTDKFVVKEGSTWYSANSAVVAYYMDPRNFLYENSIFMFEKLSFDAGYQTIEAIESVLAGKDILAEKQTIYNAAKTYNINAIYLSSRIRQETQGSYSGYSLSGNAITLNGVYYPHVYNPYNIGAATGAYDGLVWAVNGTSYSRPWLSIPTAIMGGADFISDKYISKGQDTGYFQKYNTSSYTVYNKYANQYMTNVRAAASEASISYNGYKSMDLLKTTKFKFVIPVYENMQEDNYSLPNKGNPNNHLSAITINGSALNGFAHDKYDYTYYVATGVNSINVNGTVINTNAKISGTGNINLTNNEQNVVLSVAAENGNVQNYTIKIIKTDGVTLSPSDLVSQTPLVISDNFLLFGVGASVESLTDTVKKVSGAAEVKVNGKTSGNLSTGDTITIISGGNSMSVNAVVKGDPTGDGNINIQDLLRVQKYILGYSELTGSYLKACDNNNDGTCNILDLLRIQKHILGYLTIE